MVSSIMAIPQTAKTKRDRSNTSSQPKPKDPTGLFAEVLDESTQNLENAPRECHNVVYGPNSRLQSFHYRSREYHY
ncbi:MAG: hypothetical protein II994_01260 [Lachnospiraceae bacterium]|nr:hypothetical protein [Lachnospiraceae bacterium]